VYQNGFDTTGKVYVRYEDGIERWLLETQVKDLSIHIKGTKVDSVSFCLHDLLKCTQWKFVPS
jgi:hypothetical protein